MVQNRGHHARHYFPTPELLIFRYKRLRLPLQATGLHGMGIKILLLIVWINGTVLWTVSPHPSTPQLISLRALLSSKSANCHKWCTVFSSPICTNQAPTPSMTSLRAFRPFLQCVSHSRRLPGCSVYERSSNKPPSWRGGVVGQNENSCISEVCFWVIMLLSFLSKPANSGWSCIECSELW